MRKVVDVVVVFFLLAYLTLTVVQNNVAGAELGGDRSSLMVLQVLEINSVCSLQPVYVLVNSIRIPL